MERIRCYFENIPNTADAPLAPNFDEPDQIEERREIVDSEHVPLPAVFYAYRIPAEGTRDYLALDLLNEILSSGESSRLHHSLVYEMQIASEATSFVDGREMPGLLYIYAMHQSPEGGTAPLERAIGAVIEDVIKNGLRAEEVQKAKNKIESAIVGSRVTVQGKADQLAHAALFYSDAGRINRILDEYLSISSEEIRMAAERFLRPENRSTVLYHRKS